MRTKDDILRMIEEEDVEFIRLQFTDIFGSLKNIAVTPGQMDKVFNNKYCFEGSSVFGDKYYYEENLYLYPELDTFMILPWRPQQGKVAKIVCDVCNEDGTPFELSSRYILKKALKEAAGKGYKALVDPECEFFLFHTDENGLPTTNSHEKAGYLDVGPMDFGENARRDIVLMLEEMGFEIESSHHEHAPAQHEVDFKEAEALKAADNIETFRFAVRSIAKRFGLYATFMPKPKAEVAGSGMHTNINLFVNNRSIFRNADSSTTDEAYWFIGGILKHAKALTAIANPIVNSYKRLILGTDEISDITWAEKGEKSLVKLIKGIDDTKVELRFPDGSSNPYLLLATCIAAGIDGIENKINPGKEVGASKGEVIDSLPQNLKEAIDELNKDDLIKSVLGDEFTRIYSNIKNEEWQEYMSEVSEWEINRYLTRI